MVLRTEYIDKTLLIIVFDHSYTFVFYQKTKTTVYNKPMSIIHIYTN